MATKGRKPMVDENFFNAVKRILNGGATGVECARYMKCSAYIVSKIKNAESLEQYNEWKKANAEKKRSIYHKAEVEPQEEPKPVEQKQIVMVQVNNYMLQEQKRTNELLTLISNKLAFIIDELVGVKTGT